MRLDQLRGLTSASGWLIRTPASLTPALGAPGRHIGGSRGCDLRWAIVAPQVDLTWSSQLPFERNDGGVWAGRGTTVHTAAGVRAECGPLRVIVAPEAWHAQNRAFPFLSTLVPYLSGFVSPFYAGSDASTDLPLRFGNKPLTVLEPGQSAIELDAVRAPLTIGAGTQAQWWGPGMRNALVMSNHASGIPSVYLRTTEPIRLPFGKLEARWMVGALSESRYFDFDGSNNLRSLSGIVMSLATATDSNLTIGAERVVYRVIENAGELPARFFDVAIHWAQRSTVRNSDFASEAEQLTGLFARWVFPESGLETYVEWARTLLPTSLHSFLVAPHHSQGYTLGLQWLSKSDPSLTAWRFQTELTYLEQLRFPGEQPPSFYISPIVPQGYTQRGQTIGAAIGPSSSQFIGIDRLRPTWNIGAIVGRIRWNSDQYNRRPTSNLPFARDVSLYWGLRGNRRLGMFDLTADIVSEKRINYLFQSAIGGYGEDHTFDMSNTSLRFVITPR